MVSSHPGAHHPIVQFKYQLPKTKRLRGKASATVLDEPLAQGVIPHGSTKPERAFPSTVHTKPFDYQAGIMFERERAGAVVPKKGAQLFLPVNGDSEGPSGFRHRIMYSTFERVALRMIHRSSSPP